MPVIKFFSASPQTLPRLSSLAPRLLDIWRVPRDVLRLVSLQSFDFLSPATSAKLTAPADAAKTTTAPVYVEVRAKAKPDRTPEYVQDAMEQMSDLFEQHGFRADVRVELFDPRLTRSYFR